MTKTPSPLLPDDEQTRDRLRAGLVLFCAVAIVLAGTVVPAISGAGLGETPLGSAVPQPGVDPYSQQSGSAGGSSGSGGLGALNPGDETAVGGSLADDESAFRSRNAEVHFTVQSSVSTYWRTGAYDTYTGSGWERSGDREPYTGPIEGGGIDGQRVEYRVQLDRSATALPSVWRANSLSQIDGDSLSVTDQRAFVTEEPLPAGTTYSGVSHLPPRDPTVLKTAGRDYPSEIKRRYTALPEDTDPRVAEFTSNLTADADSPYESAKKIESWLEANKDYSLNVSEPEGDVASQFVFEMEKGYCEYFATAMTVMLRSQGVPARYVVGYSTGQQVGANTYKVRGMNAHAWVEAYFPDVGWVRFDPTPGQDRLEAEQQAFENQTDSGEYEPTERGSPGEEFSPNESTETSSGESTTGTDDADSTATTEPPTIGTSTPTESDSSTTAPGTSTTEGGDETARRTTTTTTDDSENNTNGSSEGGEYEVELDRTPVPGATVEVTVTQNGTPVTGVPIYFNGEQVGVTDDAGTVTGEVPYARNLTITVGSESAEKTAAIRSPPPDFDAPMAFEGGPPRILLPGEDPADRNKTSETTYRNETNETSETEYSLATNATLTISGDVVAGSMVVVTATVQDVAVRDAEVRIEGERVGTTDENGRIRVRLPDFPGNVTLEVSRGPVSGEKIVSIPNLTVSAEPALPLALPGTPIEIDATYGGEPLSNASVRVGDENPTTDFDGTASATLPFEGSATVVVSARGQTSRTTVTGLFVNLFAVLGGAAVVLGGLGFGAHRRGLGPRRLATLLVAGLRAVPGLVVAALFGVADRLEWTLETVLDALRELRAGETTVGELLARLRAWLGERAVAARATLQPEVGRPAEESSADRYDDSYRTLREAWRSFLGTVSVRRPDAMTPGELADHAVREDGLPPGAVGTLRDAFRDVEYGARSPADRLLRVEDAVKTIERTTREAEDGSDVGDGSEIEDDSEIEDGPRAEDDSKTEPSTAGGER